MRRSSAGQAAFTLLEIMMVVAIIMLILSSGAFYMKKQFDNAKVNRAEMDLKGIETPLMMYQSRSGTYPTTDQGLKALVEAPSPRPRNWMKQADAVPIDPWGKPYFYRFPGTRNKPGQGLGYDAFSAGPDGVPDTDDDVWNPDSAPR